MKRKLTNIGLLAIVVTFLALASCQRFEDFSDIPEIKYSGFLLESEAETGITTRGVLVIDYTDGDGNIGLPAWDTMPPFNYGSKYYYNMIINYYEMKNGEWEEVFLVTWNVDNQEFDTLTFNARIPLLTPVTGNQAIKGFIQDTLFLYNPLSENAYDTIKFSTYIIDRDLNESNIVETPAIIVKRDTTSL
jgi:hypothetical protein